MSDLVPIDDLPSPTGSALWLVLVGLADLDLQRQALVDAGDVDELAVWLAQARTIRQHLGDLERNLEDDVAEMMPTRIWEHPRLGTLQRRKGTERRAWRWDELLTDVWPVLAEKHDGDMGAMVTELLNLIGLTGGRGPRLEPLRKLGFSKDEYCEASPGRTTVQVVNKDKVVKG